jgi:hypothetical protein
MKSLIKSVPVIVIILGLVGDVVFYGENTIKG